MKPLTHLALTITLLLTICNGSFAQGFVPITASGTVEIDSLGTMQPKSFRGHGILGDPVPGLDISLQQIPGGVVRHTTSNGEGGYSFTISQQGTYRVWATPRAGVTVVFPPETSYTFTADNGVNRTDLNFRLRFAPASTPQDNWAYFPSGTNQTLQTVTFFNADTGFAAGGGIIVRTLDGGKSWTVVSDTTDARNVGMSPMVENHNSSRSNRSFPVAPGAGEIVGNDGEILVTVDYGASFTRFAGPTSANLYGITNDGENYSGNIIYAVGDGGTIIKCTDGGTTWFTQISPTTNSLHTVTFWNADTGIAAGDGGVIVRTTNGGALWTIVPESTFTAGGVAKPMVENHNSSRSNRGSSANPGGGVLTGDLNPIYRIRNFGLTYDPVPTAQSADKGYCAGKGGDGIIAVGDNGAFLLSTDDGFTWTSKTSRTNMNLTSAAVTRESMNMQTNTLQISDAVVVGDGGTVGVLAPPGFAITQPGPVWCGGTSQTLTWSGGNPGWSVSISLIDVSTWTVRSAISTGTPNDGSEVWNIPSNIPDGTYEIYVQEVGHAAWSYSPAFIVSPCSPQGEILLSVDSVNAGFGDTVAVPVRVTFPEAHSYSSAELTFAGFQNQGLTFLGIDTAGSLIGQNGWLLSFNPTDSLLVTASAGAQSISGSGILYTLRFLVSGGSCSFIPVTVARALFDTGADTVRPINGGVFVQPTPTYGDADENGLIQAFDASMILRHLTHIDTLSCRGLTNANVSNDSTVSALDASLILMYVVGLIDHLPYDTTIVAAGNIAMVGGPAGPGDTIAIPILLSNGANIVSFEGMITFDPSRLTFSRVQWSSTMGGFVIESHAIDGHLFVAAAGTSQDGSAGVFGTMYFINLQTAGQTPVTFSRLRWNEGTVMENVATATIITGVDENEGLPTEFALEQNYPNPFNPLTKIRLAVPTVSFVSLKIFNTLGQEAAVLVSGTVNPGNHQYTWLATGYPSGVYFYSVQAIPEDGSKSSGYTKTKKLILIK